MEFESQICTTKEQSERLLALGLKRDTADMHHYKWSEGYWDIQSCPPRGTESCYIPAWSLHRLMEISDIVNFREWTIKDTYDKMINLIEHLISTECFNKEYLENK